MAKERRSSPTGLSSVTRTSRHEHGEMQPGI